MTKSKTYSKQFWLLCTSAALFFGSFNMVIPELPDYLTSIGGEDYKGWFIPLFTLAALISRPFSGKLADTIGRKPVMLIGAGVCVLVGVLYPLFTTVFGFLALRFLHGFSTGFKPTGVSAVIADLIPINKRGEAMGVLGVFTSTGMALGPAVGPWIKSTFSMDVLFIASGLVGILTSLMILVIEETLENPQPFKFSLLKVNKSEFYEPRTVGPATIFMLNTFAFGAALTISADFSKHVGVPNKGYFFTIFVVASLFVRMLAGKVSDKYGRVPVLMFSSLMLAVSMYILGTSTGPNQFYFAAFIFGMSVGINSPTIMAWTVDLSLEKHRGRGLATMFIGLEIGIGLGAFLSAYLYGNNPENFDIAFGACGVLSVIGFLYLIFWQVFKSKKYTSPSL